MVVLIGAAYKEFLHYQIFPKRFGIVESGEIYRSGQIHPALIEKVLVDNEIVVVVDLQYWEEKPGILAERDAVTSLGIDQFRFPLNGDGTGDIESYALAIQRIHQAVDEGKPVLVHCAAGSQRTGGVVAAYRTLVQGQAVDEAIAEMERYEWDPEDDRILLEYLDANLAKLSTRLVELGVLEEVPRALPSFTEPK
jgi:hypothetical protein